MSRKTVLHDIIFGTDTKAGRLFDIILMIAIILSIIVVMLDSVSWIHLEYGYALLVAEWVFTILFTVEYVLRISTTFSKLKYVTSFYGIIDLLAILPTYISIFLIGYQYLIIIRVLRLLRIFRILKLYRFIGASSHLVASMKASRHKIAVFLSAVMAIVVVMGAAMYLIEGPENGFRSIPESIYWAIITLTTVGYGDITPITALGKALASIIMLTGYSIIAVPTGIITAELSRKQKTKAGTECVGCSECGNTDHDKDANFCKVCGKELRKSEV
ncbi:MAG: ion transporter [Bacteroidetes bacterium]|nr:MAG: ion transporter [Bacteroidota bacterium]RLD82359.1 MAG: ion transporter [Bacteroidota bacterium]